MAMKKKRGGRRRRFRDMIKMSPDRSAESAAEPESQSLPPGVIRFETGKLPTEFAEFDRKRESNLPGRVVVTIVALSLILIAVIAWFIAHEPPK
jgi:hypothetical protein